MDSKGFYNFCSSESDVFKANFTASKFCNCKSAIENAFNSFSKVASHKQEHYVAFNKIKWVSWNAQSLFHHQDAIKLQKVNIVKKLLVSTDILTVQEVHGNYDLVLLFFREFFRRFYIHHSFLARDAGGALTFINKNIIKSSHVLDPFEISKGRIVRSEIFNHEGQHFIVYNSHIHDTKASISTFKASVFKDSERSSFDSNYLVFFVW